MMQIGVIYNWNAALPRFKDTNQQTGLTPVHTLETYFQEHHFDIPDYISAEDPVSYLSSLEDVFFDQFESLLFSHAFFKTLLWLKKHSPQIRQQIRNDFLFKVEKEQRVAGIMALCHGNKKASSLFTSYVKRAENWSDKSLFTLEQEIDELCMQLLYKSVGTFQQTVTSYVDLLSNQYKQDFRNRHQYTLTEEGHEPSADLSDEQYKKIAHAECSFGNEALFTFDPDLIVLQCYIRYKYFFYNAKLKLYLSENTTESLLINYDLVS